MEYKGEQIADSSNIITRLTNEFNVDLDSKYSESELNSALAYKRLIEDNLYWCIVYDRWIANWRISKEELFKDMPPFLRFWVPALVKSFVAKQLRAQGTGDKFT